VPREKPIIEIVWVLKGKPRAREIPISFPVSSAFLIAFLK
jgi:hypothetical protein